MPDNAPRRGGQTVRIGFLSRIDYGSDGFRQGLIDLAAETFRNDNCNLVVLAAGLVAGKQVERKATLLAKEKRALARQLKALTKGAKNDAKRQAAPSTEAKKLQGEIEKLDEKIAALTPSKMAAELAKRLPRFTNAKGKAIKLYIVPSTPYDRQIGIETAALLAKLRGSDELRVLSTDGDRLPLWEDEPSMRILEVLTLDKQAWIRGDYDSTAVQRRIKDKRRQSSAPQKADIQVVGGVGVSILKPQGNWPIGFMALPVCHRIEATTTAERQVGVQVMEVDCDRRNVTMRSHSYRDVISNERTFIGTPADISPARQKCLDLLKATGRLTTGRIADRTKLSREEVMKTLGELMARPDHKRYKTWPGLVYDEVADRWDFDLEWVKMNLRYELPVGERKVDRLVAICCLHAGSLDTDYAHFLTEVPRVMLATGSTELISAGDHIEGTEHDLLMKGEVYGGFDNTKQEKLAALMIATALFKVFKARFEASLKDEPVKAGARDEISARVLRALPMFRYVPGNHCSWISRKGVQPLVTMVHEIVRNLNRWISNLLSSRGLPVDDLVSLVEKRVETVGDGRFTLPSGLGLGMTHPHMGGSETISSSAQKALMLYRDCPVVIIGNFHTGVVVEEWDPVIGQRICAQVPTFKHGSGFEHSKMKTVDQGFPYIEIHSVAGRIVLTIATFFSNDKATAKEKRLDPDKPFHDFLAHLGITP